MKNWVGNYRKAKVSKVMQEYFANFIKTGAPNGKGLSVWPKFAERQLSLYERCRL